MLNNATIILSYLVYFSGLEYKENKHGIEMIARARATDNGTCLMYGILHGWKLDKIQNYLENGADPNACKCSNGQ